MGVPEQLLHPSRKPSQRGAIRAYSYTAYTIRAMLCDISMNCTEITATPAVVMHLCEPSKRSKVKANLGEPNTFWILKICKTHPPCEKVIFAFERRYITCAVRKLMLDMLVSGSFWNIHVGH